MTNIYHTLIKHIARYKCANIQESTTRQITWNEFSQQKKKIRNTRSKKLFENRKIRLKDFFSMKKDVELVGCDNVQCTQIHRKKIYNNFFVQRQKNRIFSDYKVLRYKTKWISDKMYFIFFCVIDFPVFPAYFFRFQRIFFFWFLKTRVWKILNFFVFFKFLKIHFDLKGKSGKFRKF